MRIKNILYQIREESCGPFLLDYVVEILKLLSPFRLVNLSCTVYTLMYNLFLFRTCDFSHSNYVVFLKEWRNNFSLDPISLFSLITNSPENMSCSESLRINYLFFFFGQRINYLKSFKFPMNVMDGFYV